MAPMTVADKTAMAKAWQSLLSFRCMLFRCFPHGFRRISAVYTGSLLLTILF